MSTDFSGLTILATIVLVRWFTFEAASERAARKGTALIFRAPVGLRILFGLSMPGMIYAASAVAFSENGRTECWLSVMFVGSAFFIALVSPAEIRVSDDGVCEKKWLGFRKKMIRWDEVEYATANPAEDSLDIVSRSGLTIKHTKYHVSRAEFVKEVRNRCSFSEPGRGLK